MTLVLTQLNPVVPFPPLSIILLTLHMDQSQEPNTVTPQHLPQAPQVET